MNNFEKFNDLKIRVIKNHDFRLNDPGQSMIVEVGDCFRYEDGPKVYIVTELDSNVIYAGQISTDDGKLPMLTPIEG